MMIRRILRVVLLGFLLGLGILVLQHRFDIPSETIRYWYPRLGIAVVILSALGYSYYLRRFHKALYSLVEKYHTKDREAFLEENLKLLDRTKNKTHRALVKLNLSAAYAELGRFQEAKELLDGIPEGRLTGVNQYVRIVNLTYMNFRLGHKQEALDLIDAHRDQLLALEKRGLMLSQSIEVNFIYEAVAKGEIQHAKELIDAFQKKDYAYHLDKDMEELKRLLEE